MGIAKYVEDVVGHIFSEEGIYEPSEITFTVSVGKRVELGDIVCIEHPSKEGVPVFYQVIDVPLRRKARDYEEDLLRVGTVLTDETRDYPRARAKQVGYYEDLETATGSEDLLMLIEHIKPLAKVYIPKPEVVEKLLRPSAPSIVLGKIYPSWKHTLRIELPKLMRQGMLVVGGVGTGKTTTMLTVITRLVSEVKRLGGKPHVLIIDKDGEYGTKELIEACGDGEYVRVDINNVTMVSYVDKEKYLAALLPKLGYYDRRSHAAKAVCEAVRSLKEQELLLTPDFVKEKIVPVIKSIKHDVITEINSRIRSWKEREGGSKGGISTSDIVGLLRSKVAVHIDLSGTKDFDEAFRVLDDLLLRIYFEALRDESFGCVVAIDEAHLYVPEVGRGIQLSEAVKGLKKTIELIATTGARNGVTLIVATQRPSLISKTITTQMGQNIIAHRVEDVDLERIVEIMGPVARRVRVLPRGWALVKSLAIKVREPLIVRIEPETHPASTGKTAWDRFLTSK